MEFRDVIFFYSDPLFFHRKEILEEADGPFVGQGFRHVRAGIFIDDLEPGLPRRESVSGDESGSWSASRNGFISSFHDGKPASILRVSPDLMALIVANGEHELDFRFHRPWWIWALSLLTLGMLAGAVWYSRRPQQPTPATEDD